MTPAILSTRERNREHYPFDGHPFLATYTSMLMHNGWLVLFGPHQGPQIGSSPQDPCDNQFQPSCFYQQRLAKCATFSVLFKKTNLAPFRPTFSAI